MVERNAKAARGAAPGGIQQYGFLKNQDFVCSPILASKPQGGWTGKAFVPPLNMANARPLRPTL
jgi:hypothetical protein